MGSIFDEIAQRAEKLHSDVRLGGVTELRFPSASIASTDGEEGASFSSVLLDAGLDDVFRRSEEIWSRKQSLRPATVGMGASLKTSQDLNQLSSTRLPTAKIAEKLSSTDTFDCYEDVNADVLDGRFSDAETNKFVQRTIERAQIEAERIFLNQQILERRFTPGDNLFSTISKREMGSSEPDRMARGGLRHFVNLPNAPMSHEQSVFAQKINETLSSNSEFLIVQALKESLNKLKSKEAEYIWSKVWAIFPSSTGEKWHEKRSSSNWMGHIIDCGTKFLQNEFISHTEAIIEANLQIARRGGVPGTLSRIVAYLNVKMPSRDSFEDGLYENYPVWSVLFFCLRLGDIAEASRIAKEVKELSSNPHCASLVGILKTLPNDFLNDERRLKLRAEWNAQNCRDLHKKTIYGLFLGFDCPEVNGTIEDWLWAKMFHCKFAVDPARSLRQLQTMLCTQHGERYFVGEGGTYLLYFSVLLLTGQIERAVHVLFRSEYIVHSVHVAILAHQLRLLMTTPKVSDELLTTDVHEPSVCRLNLARLLLLYVKDFELSNIEYAINYCFFARDFNLDTSLAENASVRHEGGRSVFVAAVSRIVFLSNHREAILGRLDAQGNRIPGLIDKFKNAMDINELIASIAFDTQVQGHSIAACHLYALADRQENAVKLANYQLSMCVSNAMAKETCEMVECAMWLVKRIGQQPNMDEENAAFSTLILMLKLHSFFRLTSEGKHGEAIELIKGEKILPMEPDEVQSNVSQFHEVPVEVRPLLPDLCVQSMRSIVALHDTTSPTSPIIQLLKQFAKALILYSAMIPYRFSVSTNSLLLQLQAKIV